MKRSLTSFALVSFAAMLTRPLDRFYKEMEIIVINNSHFLSLYKSLTNFPNSGVISLTLKLVSISFKLLVFPLRAVQTRLNREERTERGKLPTRVFIELKSKASLKFQK